LKHVESDLLTATLTLAEKDSQTTVTPKAEPSTIQPPAVRDSRITQPKKESTAQEKASANSTAAVALTPQLHQVLATQPTQHDPEDPAKS